MTYTFILTQGRRAHDEQVISSQPSDLSTPTQHGLYLMRSRLESLWAVRFERRGFTQVACGVSNPPCYFYEPRGMKHWPGYPRGRHYRIDFALVYEVATCTIDDELRSRAVRWDWISIKPAPDESDLEYLHRLVAFDSLHQRAFQCSGHPAHPTITLVEWIDGAAISRRL